MKTFGLLVSTVLVLSLGACMRRDRCDSNGWCDDPPPPQVCFYDQDCGAGYRCSGGTCVAPLPVPPPRGAGGTGGTVDAGRDGRGGSSAIDAGAFDGGSPPPPPADGGSPPPPPADAGSPPPPPADAGAPHSCDAGGTDGGCHPHSSAVCQFNHDCGLTGRCADGECQPACTSSADCGTGQACVQGYCATATTSGGQCVFNADCGAGATCINGYCHANCAADADCAAQGQAKDRCVSGICQPDTGPHPQCRANTDCVGVHVTEDECVDAVCRTPCLSDTDCCVGSSGSVCRMGYCATAHEIAPQCHLNTDCGSEQACIDAACE
jgi:hypothetical protein